MKLLSFEPFQVNLLPQIYFLDYSLSLSLSVSLSLCFYLCLSESVSLCFYLSVCLSFAPSLFLLFLRVVWRRVRLLKYCQHHFKVLPDVAFSFRYVSWLVFDYSNFVKTIVQHYFATLPQIIVQSFVGQYVTAGTMFTLFCLCRSDLWNFVCLHQSLSPAL